MLAQMFSIFFQIIRHPQMFQSRSILSNTQANKFNKVQGLYEEIFTGPQATQFFRRYVPHFQVELSQWNVCTLISALKSRAVLTDLFLVSTACFKQRLSYLTCDIGHKIIFSLMQDKRPYLSRSCEGQKNMWQVVMAESETEIFNFQQSKTSSTEVKTIFLILYLPTYNTFPPLIQRWFLSEKKVCT